MNIFELEPGSLVTFWLKRFGAETVGTFTKLRVEDGKYRIYFEEFTGGVYLDDIKSMQKVSYDPVYLTVDYNMYDLVLGKVYSYAGGIIFPCVDHFFLRDGEVEAIESLKDIKASGPFQKPQELELVPVEGTQQDGVYYFTEGAGGLLVFNNFVQTRIGGHNRSIQEFSYTIKS